MAVDGNGFQERFWFDRAMSRAKEQSGKREPLNSISYLVGISFGEVDEVFVGVEGRRK